MEIHIVHIEKIAREQMNCLLVSDSDNSSHLFAYEINSREILLNVPMVPVARAFKKERSP